MVPGFHDVLTCAIEEEELQCSLSPGFHPTTIREKKARASRVSYLLIAEGSQSSTSGRVGNRLITEWSRVKPQMNQPGEDSVS